MKTLCQLLTILFLLGAVGYTQTKNLHEPYQLIYTVIDINGNPVPGQTVTLKINKVSNNAYFDFTSHLFSTYTWTQLSTNLIEDTTRQVYFYTFVPSTSTENTPDQYLFIIDNSTPSFKDHDIVSVDYLNIGTSALTPSDIWDTAVSSHTAGSTGDTLKHVSDYTDNEKHNGAYQGVSAAVRANR